MMVSYFSIFLSLVTIILLAVLLIRFKKLFTTEKILEKTKAYMDRMIADLNNQTRRDMDLINESDRRTRELLKEAETYMEKFNEATERLRNMIAETEKVTKGANKPVIYQTNKNVAQIPTARSRSRKTVENAYKKVNPDDAFNVTKKSAQQSLFDEVPEEKSIIKDETLVTPDGAAVKEVPLIITKIYDDEKINPQKELSLNEHVKMLYAAGHSAKEIAAELSCSITEVQLIIDMS